VPNEDEKDGKKAAAKDDASAPADPDKAAKKAKKQAEEDDPATKAANQAAKELEKQREDWNKILKNELRVR
jgi:hypothetical protein